MFVEQLLSRWGLCECRYVCECESGEEGVCEEEWRGVVDDWVEVGRETRLWGKEEKRREGVLNSMGMKLEVDCVCVSASCRHELFQILRMALFWFNVLRSYLHTSSDTSLKTKRKTESHPLQKDASRSNLKTTRHTNQSLCVVFK